MRSLLGSEGKGLSSMAKTREGSKLELSRPGPALLQVEKFFDELKRDFCLFWKSLLAGNFEKNKKSGNPGYGQFFSR